MKSSKGTQKICSRGHKFYKSSDCPVCPKCWVGYYKDRNQSDFPKISAPALRALLNAKIRNLRELSRFREEEIVGLHGMGPSTMPKLRAALRKKGWAFKK